VLRVPSWISRAASILIICLLVCHSSRSLQRPVVTPGSQSRRPAKQAASGKPAVSQSKKGPNLGPQVSPKPTNPAPAPSVIPPPRSLLYGVNVVWSQNMGIQDWDRDGGRHGRQLLSLLKLSGATHTRVPVRWSDVEKSRGHYDWSALDRLIAQLRGQGLVVTGVVRSAPDWAVDNSPATRRLFAEKGLAESRNDQPLLASAYPDWIRFAAALGAHFKDSVTRWEVGYQPDGLGMPIVVKRPSATVAEATIRSGGDASTYTRLLKLFSESIKRAQPQSTVAVGALSVRSVEFLQAIYSNGGRKAFDAVALCPTGGPNGFDFAWVDLCRQTLIARGDAAKDFWLAEWGWDSYPEDPDGLDQGQQARLLRSTIAAMRGRGFIQQADWRSLVDQPERIDSTAQGSASGLCTSALKSKLAFAAFQREALPGLAIPRQPSRTLLVGGPSRETDTTVHVDLDAGLSAGAMPTSWLGVDTAAPFPIQWEAIGRTLKSRSASWVRINPFQSGWIRRTEATGWTVDYAGLDRMLRNLALANLNVILQVSAVPQMSMDERMGLVRGLAERYGKSQDYSVFRWEFAGQSDAGLAEYETFAHLMSATVPERPVGFASIGEDPVRDSEAIAKLCAARGCLLTSFSWEVKGKPVDTARAARSIREALARYPALKTAMLMPSMSGPMAATAGVSQTQRLIDSCPLEQPHGLMGILTPLSESMSRDGALDQAGRVMALVNRLQGVRLYAHSDFSSVRCLAARSSDAIHLIVWQDDGAHPSSSYILKVHGLPEGASVRIEQTSERLVQREASSSRSARLTDGMSNLPDSVADISPQAGNAEAAVPLESGSVSHVTLQVRKPQPLSLSLSTARMDWYAGEMMDVDCEVRNNGRTAQNVEIELLPGPSSPLRPMKSVLDRVGPGEARRMRFRARVISDRSGVAFINARVSGDVRSSIAIRIVPPITAKFSAPRYDVGTDRIARPKLLLTNMTHSPVQATIRLADPPDSPATDITVPADGKAVQQEISVKAPSATAGIYPVEVAVEGVGGRLATLTALVGVPLECRYASLKPTIDGDLSEWTSSDTIGMGRAEQVHDKVWRGPTDLSAYAYLRWDEQFLYLACAVTDDIFFQPYSATDFLKGDSVLFAVSGERQIPPAASGYGPSDHEFGIGLLDGTHPVLARFAGPAGTRIGTLARGVVAAKRVGSRIFYEAAIPWSELVPLRAKEGTVMGFAILVNDNDGKGKGYISWGDGLAGEKRPLLFPPVKLVR